jgi:hypothetical protein
VCFVMDYLELHFNGSILRALEAAVMETPGGRWIFPQFGSREAMCDLIGAIVVDVAVDDTRSIDLRLDGDRVFTIPLDAERGVGREAAHFVPGLNRPIAVW